MEEDLEIYVQIFFMIFETLVMIFFHFFWLDPIAYSTQFYMDKELGVLWSMCNELFISMEGKPNEFDFVKKILVDGIMKLSTNGSEVSSSMNKARSISRFSLLI